MGFDWMEKNDTITLSEGFGYPSFLLGISENAIHDNVTSALKSLYENKAIPYAAHIFQQLDEFLGTKALNCMYVVDYSHIACMQENQKEKSEVLAKNVVSGINAFKNNMCNYTDLVKMIDENPFYDAPLADPLSPLTFVDKITVPVFLAGAWQDEQTGSRFASMIGGFDASPDAPATLEPAALAAIGADLGDSDINALVEAVSAGRPDIADQQMARLSEANIPGIVMLRGIARRFWLLLELRLAVEGGLSPQSAVDGARPPVFWKAKPAITSQLGRTRVPQIQIGRAHV